MKVNFKKLGGICKRKRIEKGFLQKDIAKDLGYSLENISAFENGRNGNLVILLWYMEKGLTFNEIMGAMSWQE